MTAGPTAGAAEEGMLREAHWAWLLGATMTATYAYSFWKACLLKAESIAELQFNHEMMLLLDT